MARLIIEVDIDVNPTLEDPQEVADNLLLQYDGTPTDYADAVPISVNARWES